MSEDQAVRDAAVALQSAITAAKAAGYTVEWPGDADGLSSIAVSSSAQVAAETEQPSPEPSNE